MKRFLLGWMVAAAAMGSAPRWSAAAAEEGETPKPAAEAPAAETPAPEPAEADRVKPMHEAERARIEKQLTDTKEKLPQLQQDELELSIKILTAENAALKAVEDPNQLNPAVIKESKAKGVPEYRNMCMACAEQWQLMESKYAALHRNLQHAERKRDSMPNDLKASLDEVLGTILKHRRDLMEKTAALYTKIADDKRTLGVYVAIYQMLPEEQREADTTLKQKIVDLKKKIEDAEKTKNVKSGGSGKYYHGGR